MNPLSITNLGVLVDISEEIRTQNCFKSMQLLTDHCKSINVKPGATNYDEK